MNGIGQRIAPLVFLAGILSLNTAIGAEIKRAEDGKPILTAGQYKIAPGKDSSTDKSKPASPEKKGASSVSKDSRKVGPTPTASKATSKAASKTQTPAPEPRKPPYTPRARRGEKTPSNPAPAAQIKDSSPKVADAPRGLKPLASFPDASAEKILLQAQAAKATPRPPRGQKGNLVKAGNPSSPEPPKPKKPLDYSKFEDRRKRYLYNAPEWTNSVALTFDDGPHETHTPRLLAYLKKNHLPATFFLLGTEVEKHPSLLIEIAESGFDIGNHTWDHPDLNQASESKTRAQLQNTSNLIEDTIGRRPTLFRPPFGNSNKAVIEICDSLKMGIINWSIDTEDWKSKNADVIYETVEKHLKGGAIILMHDIYGTTIDAVPRIVELIHSRGLRLVTVSEMLRQMQSPPPTPTPVPTAVPTTQPSQAPTPSP